MALSAVSGVKLENKLNFNGRYKNEDVVEDFQYEKSSQMSRKAAAVPVIVLMSMNPSLLKAEAMNMYSEESTIPEIEVSVPESEYEKDVDARTYVMAPEYEIEAQQSPKAPYGWAIFNNRQIRMSVPTKINGANYHMLFTASKYAKNKKDVEEVYFVKDGQRGSRNAAEYPIKVKELIYHDIGKDKEFCGVRVFEYILDANGNSQELKQHEIRLKDEVAQEIIDLLTGDSQWNNKSQIRLSRTKSPSLFHNRPKKEQNSYNNPHWW